MFGTGAPSRGGGTPRLETPSMRSGGALSSRGDRFLNEALMGGGSAMPRQNGHKGTYSGLSTPQMGGTPRSGGGQRIAGTPRLGSTSSRRCSRQNARRVQNYDLDSRGGSSVGDIDLAAKPLSNIVASDVPHPTLVPATAAVDVNLLKRPPAAGDVNVLKHPIGWDYMGSSLRIPGHGGRRMANQCGHGKHGHCTGGWIGAFPSIGSDPEVRRDAPVGPGPGSGLPQEFGSPTRPSSRAWALDMRPASGASPADPMLLRPGSRAGAELSDRSSSVCGYRQRDHLDQQLRPSSRAGADLGTPRRAGSVSSYRPSDYSLDAPQLRPSSRTAGDLGAPLRAGSVAGYHQKQSFERNDIVSNYSSDLQEEGAEDENPYSLMNLLDDY